MSSYPLFPSGILDHEPLNAQYTGELPNPYERTDFDQGMARQARIYRNAPARFTPRWPMSPAKYEIWLGWMEGAVGGMGGWYDIPVFRGDSYETMTVRNVMPMAPVTREGGEWIVAPVLETMSFKPRDAVTTAAAMITYGSDLSLEELVDLLHHVVHVDYPGAVL